jgi:hypothetical protein
MKLVLAMMKEYGEMGTKEDGDKASITTDMAKGLLEELWMLDPIDRSGEKTFVWELSQELRQLPSASPLGTQSILLTCPPKKGTSFNVRLEIQWTCPHL